MKLRKLTAFLLVLCMMLSLGISAFAADDGMIGGTIANSSVRWALDAYGCLTISGSGDVPRFESADDQPWADHREKISEVWFDDMQSLTISDIAYWFEDCIHLYTAEIPDTTPVIGTHAFYNCPQLRTLSIYYGENILTSIGEDAFWRESDPGDTLDIGYLIGYPESSVPFHDYDWAASNRNHRYFHDLYGSRLTAASTGTFKLLGAAALKSTGVVGVCPSCGENSLQGTYVSMTHTSRGHAQYYECYLCHYVQNLGTYVYKSHGPGDYGSRTCPQCGTHTWQLTDQTSATCTRSGYKEYSCDCGQTKTETIYATGHSYSYGSWEPYSASQHRRERDCRNCSDSGYEYASHDLNYGSWSRYSDSQHSRSVNCKTCGYSTTEYGNHSYTVGAWSNYSDTQHQRTKSCSVCGDSTTEYGDHADTNGDGKCDDCSAVMKATLTWDCGDGKLVTTAQSYNAKLVLPTEPTKEGYTFTGWYTEKTGGSRVTSETLFTESSPKTYYAQWEKVEVFRVTVPVSLPLVVDENGEVHTGSAEIINSSTGDVQVSSVTITAQNGWQLVPYATDMAHAKVDAMQVGFQLNSVITTKTGSSETFDLSNPWTVSEAGQLAVDYDAVVSAVSQPITDETVLSVLFILEWAE